MSSAPWSKPKPGDSLAQLAAEVVDCRACPRLVAFRERVANEKRAAYREEHYWGLPVPGFGDPGARLWIVGLAPGAHGANRTGRVFTGDRSGAFLYPALHRAGFASQPSATGREDGLALSGVYISCPVRCVPPSNSPEAAEIARCAPYLRRELTLLPSVHSILALGAIAWKASLALLDHTRASGAVTGAAGPRSPSPSAASGDPPSSAKVPPFAHGARVQRGGKWLVGSYHASQQNTQTGRLTAAMFDAVLRDAAALAGLASADNAPGDDSRAAPRRSGR